jgi:hypothetical protein
MCFLGGREKDGNFFFLFLACTHREKAHIYLLRSIYINNHLYHLSICTKFRKAGIYTLSDYWGEQIHKKKRRARVTEDERDEMSSRICTHICESSPRLTRGGKEKKAPYNNKASTRWGFVNV